MAPHQSQQSAGAGPLTTQPQKRATSLVLRSIRGSTPQQTVGHEHHAWVSAVVAVGIGSVGDANDGEGAVLAESEEDPVVAAAGRA